MDFNISKDTMYLLLLFLTVLSVVYINAKCFLFNLGVLAISYLFAYFTTQIF